MAITKPILLDETGKQMLAAINKQNALLEVMAEDKLISLTTNFKEIQQLVRGGLAESVLNIGDQINVAWSDGSNNYTMPFDIVHFGEVELKDGEKVPGMYLQSHYLTPAGVMFDGYEAFYHCDAELPAGTYYITMGNGWGSNVVSGKSYQFTLTKAVPAGGILCGLYNMPDTAPTNWKVYAYANQTTTTAQETVSVTEGNGGTSLGTLSSSTKYGNTGLNNMQRVGYGYNRWGQSAMRQWLNSKEAAGAWWKPQNVYDRFPDQLGSMQGFMKGFSEDFLNVLGHVKVTTALNTVSDADLGATEDTFDYFFLPSLEQEYCEPQLAGAEGEYWEYWKRTLEATTPQGWYDANINPNHIRYPINAKTSPQTCRLRSANRGNASSAWIVNSTGNVYYFGYAISAHRCAPACVIC